MSNIDATQLLPLPDWEDPRIHLFDDIWLLTVFVVLIAVGLPWLFSGFHLELGAASFGLLALGSIHLALSTMTAAAGPRTPWRRRSLTALHIAGVAILGFIWQHAGNVQNPAFLAAFALPVIGAIFLSRWHSYLTAAVAVVVVTTVALMQIPELRWYAAGLNPTGAWIASLFARAAAPGGAPFSGFYAPSRYFIVLLEVFAILLFACAAAAEYLGTIFERLAANVIAANAEAERGQSLWNLLIERLPLPAVLVDADTSRIVCVSERAEDAFGGGSGSAEGMDLLAWLSPSSPDLLVELVRGDDGFIPHAAVRVGDSLSIVRIRVQHLAQSGRRFALLLIDDETQAFCVKAALDAADHAALVIDSQGRLLAYNKPASGIFSGISPGGDASRLLPDHEAGWWEPGGAGRRKMHMTLGPRVYQVTCSAVPLPGEDSQIVVVACRPVAKVTMAQQQTADTTIVSPTLVQTR